MIRVHESSFLVSASAPSGYPAPVGREVAFVGRSNVGKSSLINALTGRKKLVKVSRTPGRTRLLNFFMVRLVADGAKHQLCLCDLPGYGYAKVSKAERSGWQEMIERYLSEREALRTVVLIVDGEIGVTPTDAETLTWLRERGRAVAVVATKIDRLAKSHRIPALCAIEASLRQGRGEVLPFSSVDGTGVDTLWRVLLDIPRVSPQVV